MKRSCHRLAANTVIDATPSPQLKKIKLKPVMIIIEKTKSLTQPYKVRYTGKNNETLATSELLKNKKACWRNINAMAKNILDENDYSGWDGNIPVKDTTVPNPEVFVYDINGIKKKAGVRK